MLYLPLPGTSPPLEVLATGPDLSSIVGVDDSVAQGYIGHPVTINTVHRLLFHYKSDSHSLHKSTLDMTNDGVRRWWPLARPPSSCLIITHALLSHTQHMTQVVASLPSELKPLALSYDWLGETIYLAAKNTTDWILGIWNIKLQTAALRQLFRRQLSGEVQVTMAVNPFTG